MAHNKELGTEETNEINEQRITPEIQKQIEDLIFQQKKMNTDKEVFSESVSAIADKLGIKSAVLKRRVNIIIKEEEEGGEVKSKSNDIEFTEEYFTVKHNNEYK